MNWQQYRTIKSKKDKKEENFTGNSSKNFRAVKGKLQQLRYHSKVGEKKVSSVSLPTFSRVRLRHALQRSLAKQKSVSESEILLMCIVLLVTRLKHQQGFLRQKHGARLKLYNDDKYSYETVSVYVDKYLWLALHARALELEISLSHLADIALRLFLRHVLSILLDTNTPKANQRPLKEKTLEYLQSLLQNFSYQKRQLTSLHGNPWHGRGAKFVLHLDYCLGLKTPLKA